MSSQHENSKWFLREMNLLNEALEDAIEKNNFETIVTFINGRMTPSKRFPNLSKGMAKGPKMVVYAQLIGIVMSTAHTYNKLKHHGFVDALNTKLALMSDYSSDPGNVDGEEFLTSSFAFLQARAELLPFLREMVASLKPNSPPPSPHRPVEPQPGAERPSCVPAASSPGRDKPAHKLAVPQPGVGTPSPPALPARGTRLPTPPAAASRVSPTRKEQTTLWIIGSSQALKMEQPLLKANRDRTMQIEVMGKGGDFLINSKTMDLRKLEASRETDTLFVSFIGNNTLQKKDFKKENGVFHLIQGRSLDDGELAELVSKVSCVLASLREKFAGIIKILGPWPRYLVDCCCNLDHKIIDVKKSKLCNHTHLAMREYYQHINNHLQYNLALPTATTFVPYTEIFGQMFPPSYLKDGVHLSATAENILAQYCVQNLSPAAPVVVRDTEPPTRSNRTGHVSPVTGAEKKLQCRTSGRKSARKDPPAPARINLPTAAGDCVMEVVPQKESAVSPSTPKPVLQMQPCHRTPPRQSPACRQLNFGALPSPSTASPPRQAWSMPPPVHTSTPRSAPRPIVVVPSQPTLDADKLVSMATLDTSALPSYEELMALPSLVLRDVIKRLNNNFAVSNLSKVKAIAWIASHVLSRREKKTIKPAKTPSGIQSQLGKLNRSILFDSIMSGNSSMSSAPPSPQVISTAAEPMDVGSDANSIPVHRNMFHGLKDMTTSQVSSTTPSSAMAVVTPSPGGAKSTRKSRSPVTPSPSVGGKRPTRKRNYPVRTGTPTVMDMDCSEESAGPTTINSSNSNNISINTEQEETGPSLAKRRGCRPLTVELTRFNLSGRSILSPVPLSAGSPIPLRDLSTTSHLFANLSVNSPVNVPPPVNPDGHFNFSNISHPIISDVEELPDIMIRYHVNNPPVEANPSANVSTTPANESASQLVNASQELPDIYSTTRNTTGPVRMFTLAEKQLKTNVLGQQFTFPSHTELLAAKAELLKDILKELGHPSRNHDSKLEIVYRLVLLSATQLFDIFPHFEIFRHMHNPKHFITKHINIINQQRKIYKQHTQFTEVREQAEAEIDLEWTSVNSDSFIKHSRFKRTSGKVTSHFLASLNVLFSIDEFKQKLLANHAEANEQCKYLSKLARGQGTILVDQFFDENMPFLTIMDMWSPTIKLVMDSQEAQYVYSSTCPQGHVTTVREPYSMIFPLKWKRTCKVNSMVRNFVEDKSHVKECGECGSEDLTPRNCLSPFSKFLVLQCPMDRSKIIHPPTYIKGQDLFPNAPPGSFYILSTAIDITKQPINTILINKEKRSYFKMHELGNIHGPKRDHVELESKATNTFVYNYVPQMLPHPDPEPQLNVENDFQLHPLLNMLELSNADLHKIVNDINLPNNTETLIKQAKDELIKRLSESQFFRFLPVQNVLNYLAITYGWDIGGVQQNYDRQISRLIQNLQTLNGDDFSNIIKHLYTQSKDAAVSKEEVCDKIMRLLNSKELELLFKKIENALQPQPLDRTGEYRRPYVKELMEQHFDSPSFDSILRWERFAQREGSLTLFQDTDEKRRKRASLKTLFNSRHATGKIVFEPRTNVLLGGGRKVYEDIEANIKHPEPCCLCQESRYGTLNPPPPRSTGPDMVWCKKCIESRYRRMRFENAAFNLDPGAVPAELKNLTWVEQLAISAIVPLVNIFRVGRRPFKKAGNNIAFPTNLSGVANALPRMPNNLNIVCFQSEAGKTLYADRRKITDALNWLRTNNDAYRNINIDEDALAAYPEAGGLVDVPVNLVSPSSSLGADPGPGNAADEAEENTQEGEGEEQPEDEDRPGQNPPMVASMMLPEQQHTVQERVQALNLLRGLEAQPLQIPPPAANGQDQPAANGQDQPAANSQDQPAAPQVVQDPNQPLGTEANPMRFPARGLVPANDLDPNFFTLAFPHLFPTGKGSYVDHNRPRKLNVEEWSDHLLNYKDGRFSQSHHFSFFLFQYVLKLQTWKESRMYADRTLANWTPEQLEAVMDAEGEEADEVVRLVSRTAKKVPGSKAHCRAESDKANDYIRFLSAHSDSTEHFNLFVTLTSKETHDNDFLRTIDEGQKHLEKIPVHGRANIPLDVPPGVTYITKSDDAYLRNDILTRYMAEYITFFKSKTKSFLNNVMCDALGCTDYLVRYEFQSRGGIHAHILLSLPLGLTAKDRMRAFQPVSRTVAAIHRFVLRSLELDPHASPKEMMKTPAYADLSAEINGPPAEGAIALAMDVLKMQERITNTVFDAVGLTECHPSDSLGDRYLANGGTLISAPQNACLRNSYAERVASEEVCCQSHINLINKVGTHSCQTGNCQRRVEHAAEGETSCRYRFPRPMVGNRVDGSRDLVGAADIVRDIPPVKGSIQQVTSLQGKKYSTMVWERNHTHTNSSQPELLLIWGASVEVQYCHSEESVRLYLSKYIAKTEVASSAARDMMYESYKRGARDGREGLMKSVLRKIAVDRDYGLPETMFHLGRHTLFDYGREFEFVNALGSVPITVPSANPEPDQPQRPQATLANPGHKDWIAAFEGRRELTTFQAMVDAWDRVEEGQEKPYPKDPRLFSLYDMVSMFHLNWTPRKRFVVPHFLPHFDRRPTDEEYLFKFCVSMLRIYDPASPSLTELVSMPFEQLSARGDLFFAPNLSNAPEFAKDLWWSSQAQFALQQAVFDEGVADIFPSPNREEVVADELQNLADLFYAEIAPPEEDLMFEDFEEEMLLEEEVDAQYNYKEDLQTIAPTWTAQTPRAFRTANLGAVEGEQEEHPALELDQLNEEQQQLVKWLRYNTDLMLQPNSDHQFLLELCGGAGTGKTTTIRTFMQELKRAHPDKAIGDMVYFAAPTGCACKLLPRPHSTLHKLLHLPLGQKNNFALREMTITTRTNAQQELANIKLLVVDEKSFLGSYYMYVLDARLKEIFTNEKPFGGVSIVLMGDYAQLTPIGDHPVFITPQDSTNPRVRPKTWTLYQIKGHNSYKDNFKDVLSLTTSMRQNSDLRFGEILKNMDEGELSAEDMQDLEQRDIVKLDMREFDEAMYLCAFKKDYEPFNIKNIRDLAAPKVLIKAVNSCAAARKTKEDEAGGLRNNLLLARGMRVMLTKNIDVPAGLSNGSVGEVVGILFFGEENAENDNEELKAEIPTVLVRFREYKGRGANDMEKVFPVSSYTATFTKDRKSMTRVQLPLVPAYGMSIHKSQGQTLNKIMVNLGDREFSGGLTYTALTRVRRLEDLAFWPMPDRTRLNGFARHANYEHVKADRILKATMTRETLARFEELQTDR